MIAPVQRAPGHRQRGVFAILYGILLVPLIAMIGLSIDLSMVYARHHELQNVADSAAVAAARALDGTPTGVGEAQNRAAAAAAANTYRLVGRVPVTWSNGALSVGPTADGPWTPASAGVSASEAETFFYARVNTDALGDNITTTTVGFMHLVGVTPRQKVTAVAVAGRGMSTILPLGICAMAPAKLSKRVNVPGDATYDELVEFGFRRGVSYNLLDLNPFGSSAKSYIINPLAFPPAADKPAHYTDDVLKPLACTGAMPAPALNPGTLVHVSEGFPGALAPQLNSRFNQYAGGVCTAVAAPPDGNVKDFRGGYSGFWMNDATTAVAPSAEMRIYTDPSTSAQSRSNVALNDPASVAAPSSNKGSYGPLWAYNRPLHYDSDASPAGLPFATTDWDKLYPVSTLPPPATTYAEAATPYIRSMVPHYAGTGSTTPVQLRRILNVPLLSCPVSGSTAAVVGIGRFFMVSPAKATPSPAGIYAEFAGLTTYGQLAASTVLYK